MTADGHSTPDVSATGDGEASEQERPTSSAPWLRLPQLYRAKALQHYGTGDRYGAVAEVRGGHLRAQGLRTWVARVRDALARPTVPFIPQIQYADCGAAALTMTLRSLGLDVDENEVRARARIGQNGVTAATLVRVARTFGVSGRGVRVELQGLRHLSRGSILFWKFNHFVVFEAVRRTGVVVVDPTSGRRLLSFTEVDEAFTGIAVEFQRATGPDDPAPDLGPARRRWTEISHFVPGPRRWLLTLLLSGLLLGFTLVLPLLTQYLVDDRGAFGSDASPGLVGLVAGVLIATIVAFGALQVLRGRAIVELQAVVERDSMRSLFLHLIRLPHEFFAGRHPTELGQRLQVVSRLRDMVAVPTVGALFDAVLVVVYLVGIAVQDSRLSLVVLLSVLALGALVALTWRRQVLLAADALDAQIRSASVLQESLVNIATVKSLGAEATAEARWQNAFASEITTKTRRDNHFGLVSGLTATIQFAAPLLVLMVGTALVLADDISLGRVLAVTTLTITLFVSLTSLSLTGMALSTLAPEFVRVRDILGQAQERQEPLDGEAPRALAVRARGLRFEFPGEKARALDDVNLDIAAGGYVGVIGVSGSGKSTLAMLLSGLERPTGGQVEVGDYVLGAATAPALRERIGYVDQHSRLMSGSIRENLLLGRPEATPEELGDALDIAQATEFVEKLPMRHETRLGVHGGGLSGGQRQRLALARAVIKRPPLLILDEATNAVDPNTEAAILAGLRALGCTLIVLGHRLSLVEQADHVVVLDQGKVLASGTPADVGASRALVQLTQ